MQCVLVGNYGAKNIGDEALREYFLSAFPDVDWRVISANPSAPSELPRLPCGIRSLFGNWLKTLRAIRKADALVFGGGTLFTDTESIFACVMWWIYTVAARFHGTKYALAFQGVGPFHSPIARSFAKSAYTHASFITVRDEESLKRVGEWKTKVRPIRTFDPALKRFSEATPNPRVKTLVVIPRWNSTESFFEAIPTYAKEEWDGVRVLMMEPSTKEESVARDIAALFPKAEVIALRSVQELLTEVSAASLVLTQRYHGAIAAAALNVPFETLPQRPGDKLDALSGILAKKAELFSWLTLGQESLGEFLRKSIRLS